MVVAVGPNTVTVLGISPEAGADLSGNQFYGVKYSADRKVVLAAAVTDVCCGVLQNKPASGAAAEVLVIGQCKMLAGETIAAGDQLRIHSDGKAMVFAPDTDTTAYCCGQCSVGGASGEIIEGLVSFTSQDRGEE